MNKTAQSVFPLLPASNPFDGGLPHRRLCRYFGTELRVLSISTAVTLWIGRKSKLHLEGPRRLGAQRELLVTTGAGQEAHVYGIDVLGCRDYRKEGNCMCFRVRLRHRQRDVGNEQLSLRAEILGRRLWIRQDPQPAAFQKRSLAIMTSGVSEFCAAPPPGTLSVHGGHVQSQCPSGRSVRNWLGCLLAGTACEVPLAKTAGLRFPAARFRETRQTWLVLDELSFRRRSTGLPRPLKC